MAVASACTNSIPCASKVGSSAKVISAALRLPNGSQISDGLNKNRSDAETTVTSTSSPSSYLSSKAAVRPPKLPPITSTRLPDTTATHSLATDTHRVPMIRVGLPGRGRQGQRSPMPGPDGPTRPGGPGLGDPFRPQNHRPGGHAYPPLMA